MDNILKKSSEFISINSTHQQYIIYASSENLRNRPHGPKKERDKTQEFMYKEQLEFMRKRNDD